MIDDMFFDEIIAPSILPKKMGRLDHLFIEDDMNFDDSLAIAIDQHAEDAQEDDSGQQQQTTKDDD